MISVDVVVPSFRVREAVLRQILQLPVPENMEVRFYIVVDNPAVTLPASIKDAVLLGNIHIIINEKNVGFSATRNKGILAGRGDYVLLLDDDIYPYEELLAAYAGKMEAFPDAIGYAGVTNFPRPFNAVTKALDLLGVTTHFSKPANGEDVRWTPTANVMLQRRLLEKSLFDESLKYGGEDISLLAAYAINENSLYKAVPEAVVVHPWWDEGQRQWKRMYRYGKATADIIDKPVIRRYTFFDFTNTIETIALLIFLSPLFIMFHQDKWVALCIGIVIIAEWITNALKVYKEKKKLNLLVAHQLFLHKNIREIGTFFRLISDGKFFQAARRLDASFSKPHPSPFRLNRWKIIKTILVLVGILLVAAIRAAF